NGLRARRAAGGGTAVPPPARALPRADRLSRALERLVLQRGPARCRLAPRRLRHLHARRAAVPGPGTLPARQAPATPVGRNGRAGVTTHAPERRTSDH